MENKTVVTPLGDISLVVDERTGTRPVVFLHGLFLDKSLWEGYDTSIAGRTHIYVDMPGHGDSGDVGKAWGDADCVDALMSILDQLDIDSCSVIGHSWGAIIALRAVSRHPARFNAVGLFNMPFMPPTLVQRIGAQVQKLLAFFPRFYASQVCKALYTKGFLKQHPELSMKMQAGLARRSWREIAWLVDAVMVNAIDLRPLLRDLSVPALAVVGESDHVKAPPAVDTQTVGGGHVSPHEASAEIRDVIRRLCG